MRNKCRAPVDPGGDLIDAYTAAIVAARIEHLALGGHTVDVLARERADIKNLAGKINAALHAEHRARCGQP